MSSPRPDDRRTVSTSSPVSVSHANMNLVDTEREKYTRMWSVSAYRRYSPGERVADAAWKRLKPKNRETLYDLGAGTGRAALYFSNRGLNVRAVDFVNNALEVEVPFVQACLWELTLPPADLIFCVDVLEHIPPQKIDDTLRCMAVVMLRRGYLKIHCAPDRFGRQIGETLHLTVQPPEWWFEVVSRYFRVEWFMRGNVHAQMVVTPKR